MSTTPTKDLVEVGERSKSLTTKTSVLPESAARIVHLDIQKGYSMPSEILEHVLYMTSCENAPNLDEMKKELEEMIDKEWQQALEAQKGWPATTDVDRVEDAFAELESKEKIVARTNFTCCRTCGMYELWGDRYDDDVGYAFFHSQTTESAVETGMLNVYYGAFSDEERKMVEVGRTIVDTLKRYGLNALWNEDPGSSIEIEPFCWQRRLAEV